MKLIYVILAATSFIAVPAVAELPTPPQATATQQAQSYLFQSGAGDVFEITTSMMAIQMSRSPQLRAFATSLISDHTNLTNAALATAKASGIMPPPPELSPMQKGMISQLIAAGPAGFDRTYLQQQVPAHQMALQINQGYALSGDTPSLRQSAQAAIPMIQTHLATAQQLLGIVR